MIRILLAGEGRNELGGWAAEAQYRAEPPAWGVLEALLRTVRVDGWEIADAVIWSKIRKYQARGGKNNELRGSGAEERAVRSLALQAWERRFEAVVFCRDTDGRPERARAIEAGIEQASRERPDVGIVGAPAVPTIEGWILAMLGEANTEAHSPNKARGHLQTKGVSPKNTERMVEIVIERGFGRVPEDALALRLWRERAEVTLVSSP